MAGIDPKDRSRSPRFPTHALPEAVDLVEKIYEGVHRSPINALTAYRIMGFSGKSGASATALGSVRQYGLIEGMGDNTRVTELALRILEPATEREKYDAIVEASRQPEIFRQVLSRFEGKLPRVDEPIRAYLIREMGFSKTGADDCIEALKLTHLWIDALSADVNSFTQHEKGGEIEAETIEGKNEETTAGSVNFAKMPLSRDCFAELKITGPLTDRALKNLIRQIEMMAEIWAED